jgi:hypothetical protein
LPPDRDFPAFTRAAWLRVRETEEPLILVFKPFLVQLKEELTSSTFATTTKLMETQVFREAALHRMVLKPPPLPLEKRNTKKMFL